MAMKRLLIEFGQKKRLEDIADEKVAIKDLRDSLVNKYISEHANRSINDL